MEQYCYLCKTEQPHERQWSDVPADIKDTFEKLGIPQAERKSLAGVGAQYDSELVYHNVKAEVAAQGVVYTDIEGAYLHFIEGCSAPKHNVANRHTGCVELYVVRNATLRYSTIEN